MTRKAQDGGNTIADDLASGNGSGPAASSPPAPFAALTIPSADLSPKRIDGGAPAATNAPQDQRIRDAITKARAFRPDRRSIHCMHCWGQGREDVIRVIEEGIR